MAVSALQKGDVVANIHRLQNSRIIRIPEQEKKLGILDMRFFAYIEDDTLYVTGEIVKATLKQSICFTCTVFDEDGDVTDTEQNEYYGDSGWVNRAVKKRSYFDGYPFEFVIRLSEGFRPEKIRIVCEEYQ